MKHIAVKALIKHNDRFLLLKRENYIGGEYEIPGGRKKEEESDYIALTREVNEETGLNVTVDKLLHLWKVELPSRDLIIYGKTFLCYSDSDNIILSKEHSAYEWLKKDDLSKMNIPEWLRESISKL